MNTYGQDAEQIIYKVMNEFETGHLKSGRSNKKVTDRKQALAIALSIARKFDAKMPIDE